MTDPLNPLEPKASATRDTEAKQPANATEPSQLTVADNDLAVSGEALEPQDNWEQLHQNSLDSDPKVSNAAKQDLSQLLQAPIEDQQFLASLQEPLSEQNILLFQLCITWCSDPDLRQLAQQAMEKQAEHFQDPITAICITSKFASSRQWAGRQVIHKRALKLCWDALKTRDKSTARIVHNKLEAIRREEALAKSKAADISHFLQELQTLVQSPWSPQFEGRYRLLSKQWDALRADAKAKDLEQFELWHKQALSLFQKHLQKSLSREAQESLLSQLQDLKLQCQSWSLSDLIQWHNANSIGTIRDSWNQSLKEHSPEDSRRQQFHQHLQWLEKLDGWAKRFQAIDTASSEGLQKLQKNLESPNFMTDFSSLELVDEVRNKIAQRLQQLKKLKEQEKEQIEQIKKRLASASRLLNKGTLKQASRYIAQIEKRLLALSASPDQERIKARFKGLQEKYLQIDSWQKYAITPKLEALCEQMEALIKKQLPPPEKASLIKKLRTQWQDLNRTDDLLWERFNKAANEAFKPCEPYFKKLDAEKQANTQRLTEAVERLRQLLQDTPWPKFKDEEAGTEEAKEVEEVEETEEVEKAEKTEPMEKDQTAEAKIDWEGIINSMRQCDKEWQSKPLIDYKTIKPIRQQYQALREQLQQQLQSYYQHILDQRDTLIERARKLAEGDINSHAEQQFKLLKLAWKQTAVLPREQEQQTWQAFKAHLDSFYGKQKAMVKQKHQEKDAPIQRALAIIDEIKKISRSETLDQNQFQQLQQEFEAIRLPQKRAKHLTSSYRKACQGLEKQQQTQQQNYATNQMDTLKQCAELCCQLELGNESEPILEQWKQHSLTYRNWQQLIEARRDRALNPQKPEPLEQNPHQLLCIQLEILLNKETPDADKALRMNYQMQRLKERGLQAGKVDNLKDQMLNLEVEWLTTSITHQDSYPELSSRFSSCLQKA